MSEHRCQSCRHADLREIPDFRLLARVTSDSKPFRSGGRLFVCRACGTVQKTADARWLQEIGEIYGAYEMYHQAACNDQTVFDPASGRPSGRCEVLARRLHASGLLPAAGALLDVGAGAGAMISAFSAAFESWELFALDLDRRSETALTRVPRFRDLFTVAPADLNRQFDLITLVHSLEHLTEPLPTLQTLRTRLEPQGMLFVEVNDAERTPFDLVVADHLCHFTPRSLACLLAGAGVQVLDLRTDWIGKEISLLAGPRAESPSPPDDPGKALARTERDVAWLTHVAQHARAQAARGRFGIFGTSIAATWLASGMGEAVQFFVDEDPARAGRTHMGRPILAPAEVEPRSTVYLAFVDEVAASIGRRLAHMPFSLVAPPARAA